MRNTAQFVAGRGANNVLLTGARGTGKSSLIKACLNEFAPQGLRLIEVDKADLVDLPDLVDLVAERPGALHRLLRRPQLRRGRARLQGAEERARRLGGAGQRQPADLRHQQPPPPAARVHEGEPELPAHRGRRGAPGRGGGGEDLAVRALRAVDQLLPVHAGRIPGHRRAVAAPLRRRRGGDRRGAAGRRWCGRWSAARARAAWRSSSRATIGRRGAERSRWRDVQEPRSPSTSRWAC